MNGVEATPAGGVDLSVLTGSITPDQNLWIGTLNASSPSYGRIDDVAIFKRVLGAAEIAALNANGGTPVLTVWPPAPPAVTIAPAAGVVAAGQTITLSVSGTAEIRYTLDGSDPAPTSTLYAAPFALAASTTVKARSYVNGNAGAISTAVFVIVPALTISPPGRVLREGEFVTLAAPGATAIRFTIDGRDPTAASPVYSGPFALAASATVKARAYAGSEAGPVASACYARIPASPPNVVVVVGDDIGFNDLGCNGAVSVATPRLDALAYAGQRFTQWTTTGPGDAPSQYAFLTGRLARRAGLPPAPAASSAALDTREWTLGEVFRKQGYATAFVGTWHLGSLAGSRPTDQGFVHFHGLPWSSGLSPSPPLMDGTAVTDPAPSASTLLADLTSEACSFIAGQAARPFFLVFQPPSLPAVGASLLGAYGNRVEALDTAVGQILDQLSASGVAERTLVVFFSDGGADRNTGTFPTGSNGEFRDGKGTTWEGGVRVPALVRWPGVVPQGDNLAVFWLPDLFRSLARVAQGYVAEDRPLDGADRSDVLLGARPAPDDSTRLFLYRHTGAAYTLQALRVGKWKLHQSYNVSDPGNTNPGTNTTFSLTAPLLYDLHQDHIEHVNRAGTETTVLATLQAAATEHQATFAAPAPQLPAARQPFLGPVQAAFPSPGSGTASFVFTRPTDSLDDHYLLQTSTDLAHWTDAASDPYLDIGPGGTAEIEQVTVNVPVRDLGGAAPAFYARLKATRP